MTEYSATEARTVADAGQTTHTRKQLVADLLLLLVTAIWGSTFVMVKDAVTGYPVFPFLSLRFALATLALLAIGWKRLPSLGWRGWGSGALIGLFLFAGYAFQTVGLQYTSASKAGFITGLYVVLVPVFSALFLRSLPSLKAMLGVALATVGLALLSLSADLSISRGDLLVLGCAISFALHIVAISAFAPKLDAIALTIAQTLTVTLISAGVTVVTEPAWPVPASSVVFAAAFTGVLATAVAYGLQTAVQRFTTPTHTALIFTGEPVFAAVFGVILAGDLLTGRVVAGGLFIIFGTLISEIRWSERAALFISRYFSPNYAIGPVLLMLGLLDPISGWRGFLWALGLILLGVALPLTIMMRELRRGGISDWHISDRRERLRPIPILVSVAASGLPLVVLLALDGPWTLMLAFATALALVLINLLITLWWKISQHVSSIAALVTLLVGLTGVLSAPLLLLVPLVGWARVRVGAHTVGQVVVGGAVGSAVALGTLLAMGA